MATDRIVVGSTGDDDDDARSAARRLRDAGHEVVFAGGQQSAERLARTAVAEDALRIVVVDAADSALDRILEACADLGADDITVEHWCDVANAS